MPETQKKINEILKDIMRSQKITSADLAHCMDVKTRVITDRLRSKSPTIRIVNEIAGCLNYKMILVPKARKLDKGEYEVIASPERKK